MYSCANPERFESISNTWSRQPAWQWTVDELNILAKIRQQLL